MIASEKSGLSARNKYFPVREGEEKEMLVFSLITHIGLPKLPFILRHNRASSVVPGLLLTASFLCVDAGESQVFPQRFQEVVQIQLHATAGKTQPSMDTVVTRICAGLGCVCVCSLT